MFLLDMIKDISAKCVDFGYVLDSLIFTLMPLLFLVLIVYLVCRNRSPRLARVSQVAGVVLTAVWIGLLALGCLAAKLVPILD